MKKELFWMEKDDDGFTIIHFKDGTAVSCETDTLAVKLAFEVLKHKGTVGY